MPVFINIVLNIILQIYDINRLFASFSLLFWKNVAF